MTTNTRRPGSGRLSGTGVVARPRSAGDDPRVTRAETRSFARVGQVALVIWAIVVIVPVLWTFLASFKNTTEIFSSPWTMPGHLRFENWGRAWTKAHVGRYFLNSVLVVGISTTGTMLF